VVRVYVRGVKRKEALHGYVVESAMETPRGEVPAISELRVVRTGQYVLRVGRPASQSCLR